MEKHSRVYAEIDLDAISYNMEQMKKRVGEGAKFIAVVKTDGYGHGAVPIACMMYGAMRLRLWKKQWSFTEREFKNRRWCWDVYSRISMKK